MQVPFKDSVTRSDAPMYKILRDVPKNHNEGLHRVSFSYIDALPKKAAILANHKKNTKSRLYNVAPCVLDETECTYHNREKARQTNQ
jgi:hypothetical protein